jgi:hypothetical protein
VTGLTADQYITFLDDLGIAEEKRPPREWVQQNAKVLFVVAGISCLAFIYLEKKAAMAKQKLIQKILPARPG